VQRPVHRFFALARGRRPVAHLGADGASSPLDMQVRVLAAWPLLAAGIGGLRACFI
jgi:hypothetical protein